MNVRQLNIMNPILHGFVWIQVAAALFKVWQAIRTNERLYPIWTFPIIIILPLVVGIFSKRRIRKAEKEDILTKEGASICENLITDILFAVYLCLAFLDVSR
jgi:hydrogenase-4 membrane subunit HyfE